MFCNLHERELDHKTKNKGIPYHWIKEGDSSFSNMCYGDKTGTPSTLQESHKFGKEMEEEDKQSERDYWEVRKEKERQTSIKQTAINATAIIEAAKQQAIDGYEVNSENLISEAKKLFDWIAED